MNSIKTSEPIARGFFVSRIACQLHGVNMDKYEITVSTFNKLAKKYQDKYMDFDFYFDTYDKLCELLSTPNAHILDVGCGPGNIAKYLLERKPSFRLHGIDMAPNMIELAKINNPTGQFEVMDSRSINQLRAEYDAIICGFCMPYISKLDVENLIRHARRKLKPSGVLYISTMEGEDIRSGYQTSKAGDQVYIHYYQAKYILALLEQNHFEVIDVMRKTIPDDSEQPATDMFIYAKAV